MAHQLQLAGLAFIITTVTETSVYALTTADVSIGMNSYLAKTFSSKFPTHFPTHNSRSAVTISWSIRNNTHSNTNTNNATTTGNNYNNTNNTTTATPSYAAAPGLRLSPRPGRSPLSLTDTALPCNIITNTNNNLKQSYFLDSPTTTAATTTTTTTTTTTPFNINNSSVIIASAADKMSSNDSTQPFMHHNIHSDLQNILLLFNGQRPLKDILNILPPSYTLYGIDIIIWLLRCVRKIVCICVYYYYNYYY
jgi:uncharacterized membrane protein